MARRPALVLPLLLFAACTAAPAPAPQPPAQAQTPEPAKVALLCGERARAVLFDRPSAPAAAWTTQASPGFRG